MKTALAKMKEAWSKKDYRTALRIAAGWPRLGLHRDDIQRGWAALTNPQFYRDIGENPTHLYYKGLAAIADRYDLPQPLVSEKL